MERHEVEETISSSPVKARRSSVGRYNFQTLCFFCDDYDSSSNLHCASTLNVDKKVRDCAVLLNDRKRIAKLSAGDLIAMEAKTMSSALLDFTIGPGLSNNTIQNLPMICQWKLRSLHLQSLLFILMNV